jgi:hypothetical protein
MTAPAFGDEGSKEPKESQQATRSEETGQQEPERTPAVEDERSDEHPGEEPEGEYPEGEYVEDEGEVEGEYSEEEYDEQEYSEEEYAEGEQTEEYTEDLAVEEAPAEEPKPVPKKKPFLTAPDILFLILGVIFGLWTARSCK